MTCTLLLYSVQSHVFPPSSPASTFCLPVLDPFLLDFFPTRLSTRRLFSSSRARGCTRVSRRCCEFYNVRQPHLMPFTLSSRVASRISRSNALNFNISFPSRRLRDFNNGVFPAITLRIATICSRRNRRRNPLYLLKKI